MGDELSATFGGVRAATIKRESFEQRLSGLARRLIVVNQSDTPERSRFANLCRV